MSTVSMRRSNALVKQVFRQNSTTSSKNQSKALRPLYLDPHKWVGLPADRVFELHNLRVNNLGDKYVPNDDERRAILSTITSLKNGRPHLEYSYEIDHFKERLMNNTPSNLKGLPPRLSNIRVLDKGVSPHKERQMYQSYSLAAFEMPLLAKYRQPYVPAKELNPVKLTFQTDFSDATNEFNSTVTLSVKLEDLKLQDAQAKKFILLSGEKFDYHTKTLTFSSKKFPESTQNARWLVETLNKLLKEAKDLTKNTFDDIPVNTHQGQPQKPTFEFPESWKRPQDAPVKRHNVVQNYVQSYKERMDQDFVQKLSP